jgi:hypothetical protein
MAAVELNKLVLGLIKDIKSNRESRIVVEKLLLSCRK